MSDRPYKVGDRVVRNTGAVACISELGTEGAYVTNEIGGALVYWRFDNFTNADQPSQNRPITDEELEVIKDAKAWRKYPSRSDLVLDLVASVDALPPVEPEKKWLMMWRDPDTNRRNWVEVVELPDIPNRQFFPWDHSKQRWGPQLSDSEVAQLRGES